MEDLNEDSAEQTETLIYPQEGPQTLFAECPADIAIYGGAAGGGKSFALLMEPLYNSTNRRFGAVIFRRNTTQIRNEGGLWDEAAELYGQLGFTLRESALEVISPQGMRVKFSHLEYEKTVLDWQGAQIPLIGFDELTHFTESQFFYMLSRNRSASGVPGYIRATCNPDCDSWVRRFISWWIDEDTGYAIPERSGVIRWFIRLNDQIIWADTCIELEELYGAETTPKSMTFILSKLADNQILMKKDPSYLANLNALSKVDRMRLKDGNWNIRPSAGDYFQKSWFEVVDDVPAGSIKRVRYWDKAATKPNPSNPDPDYTVGLLLAKYPNGKWCIEDVVRFRDGPLEVERTIKNTATQDGTGVEICIEQEPGSSGVADADNYIRMLAGFTVHKRKPDKKKAIRAKPVSAQAEAGNIMVKRSTWNKDLFDELENFSEDPIGHDDQVDTLSGAFNETLTDPSILDAY